MLSQVDAIGTLADIVGARVPDGAAPHSQSMVKSWLGKSRASRSYAVKMAANHALVLRTKDWKYIEPSKGGPMIPWGPKIETGYKPTPNCSASRRTRVSRPMWPTAIPNSCVSSRSR